MKVIVIGRNGQLSRELQDSVPPSVSLVVFGSDDCNILDETSLSMKIQKCKPDLIINASAYTAVDAAETNEQEAFAINELGVKHICNAAKKCKSRLIHVSTDFVFDGKSSTKYTPESETNPINVYGKSKLAGERILLNDYPDNSVIVRTSWVYSKYGNNFVKTMIRLMNLKETLGIVGDQVGAPTSAKELAAFIWQLSFNQDLTGIYHWTDDAEITWYDFAEKILQFGVELKLIKAQITLNKITTHDYPTPAQRPSRSTLDTGKSQTILKSKCWTKNLKECMQELTKNTVEK